MAVPTNHVFCPRVWYTSRWLGGVCPQECRWCLHVSNVSSQQNSMNNEGFNSWYVERGWKQLVKHTSPTTKDWSTFGATFWTIFVIFWIVHNQDCGYKRNLLGHAISESCGHNGGTCQKLWDLIVAILIFTNVHFGIDPSTFETSISHLIEARLVWIYQSDDGEELIQTNGWQMYPTHGDAHVHRHKCIKTAVLTGHIIFIHLLYKLWCCSV